MVYYIQLNNKKLNVGGMNVAHQILKEYIYQYAIKILAENIGITANKLSLKIAGQEEFTGSEVITLSNLMQINDIEHIFLP